MRPSSTRQAVVLILISASGALTGCGNDAFAPPPPASESRTGRAASPLTPSRVKEIVFILPAEDNADLQTIVDVARVEVGNARAAYRLMRASGEGASTKQAELIKQAAADGASAIVIVPDAARETSEALAAVDQKKTPIILLGRAGVSPSGGPYTLITWPAFGPSARKIIDAVFEDVKKAGLPDDAPVLFLKNEPPDVTSLARDVALLDAIKTTKHPIAATVPATDEAGTKAALVAGLKAHPKVCAVIADDVMGVSSATSVRIDMKDPGAYLIGGYCASQSTMKLVALSQNSILVDRNVEGLIRRAIVAALDRSDGKAVPDRIEIEMPTRRAAGNTSKPIPLIP